MPGRQHQRIGSYRIKSVPGAQQLVGPNWHHHWRVGGRGGTGTAAAAAAHTGCALQETTVAQVNCQRLLRRVVVDHQPAGGRLCCEPQGGPAVQARQRQGPGLSQLTRVLGMLR